MRVLEMVSFELNSGSEDQFVAASDEISVWAAAQNGFVQRYLTQAEDGVWTDVILWESMAFAQDAGKRIMTEIGDCDAFRMIKEQSIVMTHANVLASTA
jgi:hypothetical protein